MAHIYKITDLRNDLSVVGQHSGENKNYFTSSVIVNRIVKKYGVKKSKEFLKKEIIVQRDFNESLLNELERHYIRLFNTKKPNGYNLTDGGEGGGLDEESKRKISETEAIWKIAQFEKDGTTLIKIWDCRKDIENELSLKINKISYICRGNISDKVTEGGFRWKYVDKKTGEIIEPTIKIHGNKGKKFTKQHIDRVLETKKLKNSPNKPLYPVYQYSLDFQLIRKWNTREVRDTFNLTDSQFQRIVYGLNKNNPYEYGGFLWKRNLMQ